MISEQHAFRWFEFESLLFQFCQHNVEPFKQLFLGFCKTYQIINVASTHFLEFISEQR